MVEPAATHREILMMRIDEIAAVMGGRAEVASRQRAMLEASGMAQAPTPGDAAAGARTYRFRSLSELKSHLQAQR